MAGSMDKPTGRNTLPLVGLMGAKIWLIAVESATVHPIRADSNAGSVGPVSPAASQDDPWAQLNWIWTAARREIKRDRPRWTQVVRWLQSNWRSRRMSFVAEDDVVVGCPVGQVGVGVSEPGQVSRRSSCRTRR